MNDVLIKKETCPTLSDNFSLDNSSCDCSKVCHDTVVQNINDKNYKQLYKKIAFENILWGVYQKKVLFYQIIQIMIV